MGRKKLNKCRQATVRFTDDEMKVLQFGRRDDRSRSDVDIVRDLMADGLRLRIGHNIQGDLYEIIKLVSKIGAYQPQQTPKAK